MVALCVLTGRDWNGDRHVSADPDHLRRRSSVVLGLVYLQIVLGGWLRHFGTAAALWAHAILAVAVWIHAAVLAYRIERRRGEIAPLVVPARVLGLTSTRPGRPGAGRTRLRLAVGRDSPAGDVLPGRRPDGPSDERRALVRRGDRADLTQLSSSGRGGESSQGRLETEPVGRPGSGRAGLGGRRLKIAGIARSTSAGRIRVRTPSCPRWAAAWSRTSR